MDTLPHADGGGAAAAAHIAASTSAASSSASSSHSASSALSAAPPAASLPSSSPSSFFLSNCRLISAPMVGASDPAWRLLLRRHGAQLVYSEMLSAARFIAEPAYRRSVFLTCDQDRPLAVQFHSRCPQELLAAALLVAPHCDVVDLNLGCPQRAARTGGYGAYLLDEEHHDRICAMLHALTSSPRIQALGTAVTAKIRLLPSLQRTLALCARLRAAGVSAIAVHGRTRGCVEQRRRGPADLAQVRAIVQAMQEPMREDQVPRPEEEDERKEAAEVGPPDVASNLPFGSAAISASAASSVGSRWLPPVPVLSNGNVRCAADVGANLRFTGASGIMVGEALLSDPTLFDRCGGQQEQAAAGEEEEESEQGPSLRELRRRLSIVSEYLHLIRHPPATWRSPFADDGKEEQPMAVSALAADTSASVAALIAPSSSSAAEALNISSASNGVSASVAASSPPRVAALSSQDEDDNQCEWSLPLPLPGSALVSDSSWLTPLVSFAHFRAHVYRILNADPHPSRRFLSWAHLSDELQDARSLGELRASLATLHARVAQGWQPPPPLSPRSEQRQRALRQAQRAKADRRSQEREAAGTAGGAVVAAERTLNSKQRKRARWQQRRNDAKRAKTDGGGGEDVTIDTTAAIESQADEAMDIAVAADGKAAEVATAFK